MHPPRLVQLLVSSGVNTPVPHPMVEARVVGYRNPGMSAMQPQSLSELVRETLGADVLPLVKATGFREYDARWWLGMAGSDKPPELDLDGAHAVGLGIGTYLHERDIRPDIVTAHDFRAYSPAVRSAVAAGLVAAGCRVHDIGMGLSPTAYYAQVALDIPSVAMITASHNENGWTGVKMGCERPLTFGPDEMARVKEIVLTGAYRFREGGSERQVPDFAERYIAALTDRPKLKRHLKVVVATGNGTAGAFAPRVLEAIGCDGSQAEQEVARVVQHAPEQEAQPFPGGVIGALGDLEGHGPAEHRLVELPGARYVGDGEPDVRYGSCTDRHASIVPEAKLASASLSRRSSAMCWARSWARVRWRRGMVRPGLCCVRARSASSLVMVTGAVGRQRLGKSSLLPGAVT